MHGIPAEVKDEQLEEKVSDIFSELNISISKSDIVDYHQLGEFNTIIWFINRKFCKDALQKRLEVSNKYIDKSRLGFNVDNKLLCENLLHTTSALPGCAES